MTTSIDDTMIYSLLKKYPSSSFHVRWRKVKPNISIPTTGYVLSGTDGAQQGQKRDITMNIQGAINEIALFKNARVHMSVSGVDNKTITSAIDFVNPDCSPLTGRSPFNKMHWKYGGAGLIVQSKEQFNAGSLSLLESNNQDSFAPINTLRGLLSKRSASLKLSDDAQNVDDIVLNSLAIDGLVDAGFSSYPERAEGCGVNFSGASTTNTVSIHSFSTVDNGVSGNGEAIGIPRIGTVASVSRESAKTFRFPLSMFSALASTYSAVPIGLLSSYSVNGYQVTLQLDGAYSYIAPSYIRTAAAPADNSPVPVISANTIGDGVPVVKLHDISLFIPVITILNPQVQGAIMSLYRQEASIKIGDVQVPTSLRFNTLNYHSSTYTLKNGMNQFFVNSTNKSVRALAYYIYNQAARTVNTITDTDINNRTGVTPVSGLAYPLCTSGIAVRSLECKIGSDDVTGCIRNETPDHNEVQTFINENIKAAGSCFSLFPYWNELVKEEESPEYLLENARSCATVGSTSISARNKLGYKKRNNYACEYGVISFQNSNYSDPQSGTVASGKSCNNIGRIDISMELASINATVGAVTAVPNVQPAIAESRREYADVAVDINNYRIVFVECFDEIIQASASSGVSIITNMVLP